MIAQIECLAAPAKLFGIYLYRNLFGLMLHQAGLVQQQLLFILGRQALVPTLKGCRLVDICWNLSRVKLINTLLINQNIWSARAVFQSFNFLDQLLIMAIKIQAGTQLACNQSIAEKNLTRLFRIDAAIMNPTTLVDQQAKKQATFVGHHPACTLLPAWRCPVAAQQMTRYRLYPFGFYTGHAACKHSAGLHNFPCQHPRPTPLAKGGTRMQIKS